METETTIPLSKTEEKPTKWKHDWYFLIGLFSSSHRSIHIQEETTWSSNDLIVFNKQLYLSGKLNSVHDEHGKIDSFFKQAGISKKQTLRNKSLHYI